MWLRERCCWGMPSQDLVLGHVGFLAGHLWTWMMVLGRSPARDCVDDLHFNCRQPGATARAKRMLIAFDRLNP